MKAAHYIILTTIFLLSFGAKGVQGQPSLVPAMERDEIKTGIHIGQRAPDLVLESPTGEKISLSSLRGQLVLIDFWAAWCPPCRRDNPNLVKLYRQYMDKEFVNGSGFTIYSVSLDRKMEDWTAAIEKDSLEWKSHVSDLKGRQSAPVDLYEVRSIPFNTLIDGDGIILSVGLRGSHLEAKLKELLK
jgi:thiol-disulfide isomerase/thioredoxin